MKAERIKDDFRPRGATAHDDTMLLLRPTDAIALVNDAADEGVPIVGITGFAAAGDLRAPMDHVADFTTDVRQGHGCWEAAEAFIRGRSGLPLVFDIELGSDPLEVV